MECKILEQHASLKEVDNILDAHKTVAIVVLSSRPKKENHQIGAFLKGLDYTIIPVYPKADEVLGEKAYSILEEIP